MLLNCPKFLIFFLKLKKIQLMIENIFQTFLIKILTKDDEKTLIK